MRHSFSSYAIIAVCALATMASAVASFVERIASTIADMFATATEDILRFALPTLASVAGPGVANTSARVERFEANVSRRSAARNT